MLSKADRQRNALLAEREAECRRLRIENARYRAALEQMLTDEFIPRWPPGADALLVRVRTLAAVTLAAAEREPSEAQSLEPGSQPEKEHDDQKHADDCPDDVVHRRHGRMIAHGD
jgi:hypothetical protein